MKSETKSQITKNIDSFTGEETQTFRKCEQPFIIVFFYTFKKWFGFIEYKQIEHLTVEIINNMFVLMNSLT